MGIGWLILIYLVIGVCLAIWYAKLGKGTAEHCIGMVYAWPIIFLVGLFIVWPTDLFDKLIRKTKEKKREKERLEKQQKLGINCTKCIRNEMCPESLRPLFPDCYDHPKEGIK